MYEYVSVFVYIPVRIYIHVYISSKTLTYKVWPHARLILNPHIFPGEESDIKAHVQSRYFICFVSSYRFSFSQHFSYFSLFLQQAKGGAWWNDKRITTPRLRFFQSPLAFPTFPTFSFAAEGKRWLYIGTEPFSEGISETRSSVGFP